MENRVCKKCSKELPISDFRKYIRNGKDYWGYECRDCGNAVALKYHHDHKDEQNAKARVRYYKDPEKHREKGRNWYYNNRDRSIKSSIEWRKNNRDSDRAASSKWRKSNPEASRLLSKKRRAKIAKASIEEIFPKDIEAIKNSQKGKCAICKCVPTVWHIDHIQPLFLGGAHAKRNLQMLCQPCNLSKSSKDPIDYMRSVGRLL